MKINLLDWIYALGDKTKPFSVREIIGNRLALTAPDYTRLYLGMEEAEKIIDANVLLHLGNLEYLKSGGDVLMQSRNSLHAVFLKKGGVAI